MRIFVEKGERLGKMQTWLISTETSDARGWFGDTMEGAIINQKNRCLKGERNGNCDERGI